MKDDAVKKTVYGALMAAAIMVATAFIKIPAGTVGYLHIGDGVIFCAAALLGPYACIPAALGSALADLIAGYGIYAPASFIIKALMGLIAGLYRQKPLKNRWFIYILAELIMISGYFLFEWAVYSAPIAAASLVFNSIQAAFGVAVGIAIAPVVMRAADKSGENKGSF